jgi:hypothetical protein
MAKFQGVARHNDLEGGHWQLIADDGTEYVLEGDAVDAAGSLADGARVIVDGAIDRGAMSLAMTGPTLRVKSIKRA